MDRFPKYIAAGVLAMLMAGPALAQQAKGQVPTTAAPGMTYGGITPTPWFGDKAVQLQLRLSSNQIGGINKAYSDNLSTYNNNVKQLEKNLNEQQRAQKLQDFQTSFNQNVSRSVDTFLSDPKQRERYNQLYLQYQGHNAFNDPTLQQRLNLSNEQRQQIAQYGQEWNKQMGVYHQTYQADPQGTTDRFNALNQQTNDRFNSVLNEQQRLIWRQVNGEAYNFPPNVYFQR
jgi:hypothetical protein